MIVTFCVGAAQLVRGEWLGGLISILFGIPVALGQFIAFGLAIDYAEERNLENQKEEID